MPSIGKQVGSRHYVHVERLASLSEADSALVALARKRLPAGADFNLVRIDSTKDEVAFLNYPELGLSPFPSLADSWRVHVATSLITRRTYSNSLNPPILHRTELLLPDDHPARAAYLSLTQTCEAIGLFDNPTVIGFRRNWESLIEGKGFALSGPQLVPIGNSSEEHHCAPGEGLVIQRHRTALSRSSLSAPVQCLLRDDLLTPSSSLFDYGCGKGDDIATLQAHGYRCSGWDPHFRPDAECIPGDVVNLGFVINVIEDYEERVRALESAYAVTRRVLAVSAMLATNGLERFSSYRDGVVTRRATFQKYYGQGELQHFLELVLGEDAYSAAPGVFYVFKDRELEQRYLLRKARGISTLLPALTTTRVMRPAIEKRSPPTARHEPSEEALDALERLWQLCLERGRVPDVEEVAFAPDLQQHFGSFKKALRQCVDRHDQAALEAGARQRRGDILVMLALRQFERRRQFSTIDQLLSKDIRSFFGSMRQAEAAARELLFSIQNQDLILESCSNAAVGGLGHVGEAQSLHIHTSLLGRLPPVLRVFVGCASAMAGDLATYDVAKIHVGSAKVTLLQYDDFAGRPLPALVRRVKVRLKDQAIDVFDYGEAFEPTLLFQKSRYINEEFPKYAEQLAFEETLITADLVDSSPHGPAVTAFEQRLRHARHRIVDFQLLRSDDVPSLDELCGAHFRYRQLIECGETWARDRPNNQPKSPETFNALCDLARAVLDPVIDYYGSIKLTYGFASPALTRRIESGIAPHLDQHASCEASRTGRPVCERLGAAVDFLVEYEDMREVARWIASNCAFDRLYFYGSDRPIHVSVGPQHTREMFELVDMAGRRVPRKLQLT